MTPYLAPPKPRLFAHRGASACFPENTLPAFAAAVAVGLPYLEMDVRATRDGVVMVHHDPTLERLCNDPRPLSDLTFDELRQLDAGWGYCAVDGTHPHRKAGIVIPTLTEVLAAFPQAWCNIEIKQGAPAIEALVIDTIRAAGATERVLLAAEQDNVMVNIRALCGAIPTSLSFGEAAAFYDWLSGGCRGAYRSPGVALQIPPSWEGRDLITPAAVAAAHAVGLEIHVWTINDIAEMLRLLTLGVDGIMSDYPERLQAAIIEFNRRQP